ncbi:MAG: hypothetical protein ACREP8_02665 [Candidatus Binatia bacterium]
MKSYAVIEKISLPPKDPERYRVIQIALLAQYIRGSWSVVEFFETMEAAEKFLRNLL